MGCGDEILAAGQAQRLYERDPSRRVAICAKDGRPRWHAIWDGNPILATPTHVHQGEDVQRVINAPHARPYIVYPFTAQQGWTFNREFRARDYVAKIYLTPEELGLGVRVRDHLGPFILVDPWSKHENLRWPRAAWEALIAARPDLTFVQHTYDGVPFGLEGAHLVHTDTFRKACGVVTAARLYIRGESGMCHATAALGMPQVTIWGGCMDWDVLGGYPQQTGLLNYTAGSPCGSWLPCHHCRDAMAGITVEQVLAAMTTVLEIGHGLS